MNVEYFAHCHDIANVRIVSLKGGWPARRATASFLLSGSSELYIINAHVKKIYSYMRLYEWVSRSVRAEDAGKNRNIVRLARSAR